MSERAAINYRLWTYVLLLVLLLIRLAGMIASPLGLHGDEAQYWAWAQEPAWGYFTKPPMIAWVIWTTTAIFGDAEWAVRLSSPILHTVTAFVIYRTARFLFGEQTGFWAAALYALMPALWLSAGIVSTDVPLLLCWAVALNAWVHLREGATWPRAVQLGLAVGFGLLAKYAMLFFLPALGLAFLFDPKSRAGLNSLKGYAAGIITLNLVTPNILWNLNHDFATLSHTVANANIQNEIPFHPLELLSFWLDQMAVFGPVTLVLLILALIAALRGRLCPPAGWLAAFVLSPLVIISAEALISRANANWAVTAYIAAPILTAHYGVKNYQRVLSWLRWGVVGQSAICIVLVAVMLVPAWTNALGLANSVKRLRAWPETVDYIETVFDAGHDGESFAAAAVDKRIIYYDLVYYGLPERLPVHVWMYKSHPENHAELTNPLPAAYGPYLIVNYYDDYEDELREDFDRLDRLPDLVIDLGGGKERRLKLWAGYGYTPTQDR